MKHTAVPVNEELKHLSTKKLLELYRSREWYDRDLKLPMLVEIHRRAAEETNFQETLTEVLEAESMPWDKDVN